jgi:hypothetical protein
MFFTAELETSFAVPERRAFNSSNCVGVLLSIYLNGSEGRLRIVLNNSGLRHRKAKS